jgi:hypothetical protein
MKHSTRWALAVLVFVLATVLVWRLLRPSTPNRDIAATNSKIANTPETATKTVTEPNAQRVLLQPNARTPYLGLVDPRWPEYWRKRERDPASEWRSPIKFFGKVVDEKNQPVTGASVEFSWSGTIEKYGADGVVHRTTTSDSNGQFVINGVEGKGLTVRVSKKGYYSSHRGKNNSFEYAGFWEPTFIEPDRNKPVVFRLVKRPEAEPTYRVGERLLLPPPAWVAHIDLLGKPAETNNGGDMTLRIVRPPNSGYQNPFDWELKIEGNGGAEFSESDEEFMLRAPDDGYQSAITKRYERVRGNSIQNVRFYVRNKTRKFYAAVSLEVTAYYPMINVDKSCIIIEATVNPNDSPNVEYDPKQDIREMTKK